VIETAGDKLVRKFSRAYRFVGCLEQENGRIRGSSDKKNPLLLLSWQRVELF